MHDVKFVISLDKESLVLYNDIGNLPIAFSQERK